MALLFTIDDLKKLIHKIGILELFKLSIEELKKDFTAWDTFQKSARVAAHYPHGVIELMPISNDQYYAYKFVNGHPNNPEKNKLTVAATGALADVETGYTLFISEMTILTAIRTAATSALASTYLARPGVKCFGMIGTGAQSEFQTLAHYVALGISDVFYYDIDSQAMSKFAKNMQAYPLTLHACTSVSEVVAASDIVTTATADKRCATVLYDSMIKPGMHINGVGGDCPGKTELDMALLNRCKIVVEYLPQTKIEGEIQHLKNKGIYAELWELTSGKKLGRESDSEITLFDSVGFALEDYAVLTLVYRLAQYHQLGQYIDMTPSIADPKDLFQLV